MTTGPQDPAAAGGDGIRAGHADREQVIETLKAAFVQGRLTRDEFGVRAGRALAARTFADLAALTAGLPANGPAAAGPAAAEPARLPAPARRRPLARAAAGSGGCLVIAFAAVWVGADILDPRGLGNPYHPWSSLCRLVAFAAVVAALCILGRGMHSAASSKQRSSRGQLPPRPGPGGHAVGGGGQRGVVRYGPGSPGPRTDQTRADFRAHESPQHRQRIPAPARRAACGVRPTPGAV